MILRHSQPWSLQREFLHQTGRASDHGTGHSPSATAEWSPAVDIEEYPDRFVLRADVPGVDPAEVEVTLERGVLTLTGSREQAAGRADAPADRRFGGDDGHGRELSQPRYLRVPRR